MTATTAPPATSRVPLIIGATLFVALLLTALLAGNTESNQSGPPLSPDSTASDGTRALVLLLRELGGAVRVGQQVPDADTRVALLLRDGLDSATRSRLDDWVRAGGTLVLTDTDSPLSPGRTAFPALAGATARGTCTMSGLDGVNRLAPPPDAAQMEVGRNATSCFGDSRRAFVVRTPRGGGAVVSIGDPGVFVNGSLDLADNSVLAARLLVPGGGGSVAVLDPNPPGSGRTTLGDLIADRVFQAMLQLLVAFVLYALWRSRRVGRPVVETQSVAVAGSQFVRAVGGLQQRSHTAIRAAASMRADTRRLLSDRYAMPWTIDDDTFVDITAARTGLDRTTIAHALRDTPVPDDDALVALSHELDTIRQEVLDGRSR